MEQNESKLKALGKAVWREFVNNIWFWSALVAYAFDAKEVALAWVLGAIYFRVADMYEAAQKPREVTINLPEIKPVLNLGIAKSGNGEEHF